MKKLKNYWFPFVLIFVAGFALNAQPETDKKPAFNKHEAFSPLFMNEMANSYHSATGQPGPDYWQNKADYKIKAALDTINHRITGQMTLTYTNNSPYDLEFLWLQMDQNAFREDSKSKALYPANDRNGVRTPTQGYELRNVAVENAPADYIVDDTRMQIRLKKPLMKKGGKINIHINYAYAIPTHGKDRTGRLQTKNGWLYTIAQWYPRMAVFDEVEGWNNLPYLGTGEFYLEYGDFDYEITAPENMVVVGSGKLQNPKKVLTKTAQNRLDKASKSEETVMILTKEEMRQGTHHAKGNDGMLTWHFKMENTRDIAWAASRAFIWDAARLNLPDGKKGLAQSVYPEENSDNNGYGRSTQYTKHAVEIYSKDLFPYPYEIATNVGGHEGGMEYPGIVFCSYRSQNASLWGVINHEFGHTWFPMIVGSNERVHGWLDEGLNTFINDLATQQFNNGEYWSDDNYQEMGTYLFSKYFNPLFTRADVIHSQQKLGIEAYYKPGTALHVLRNAVLGKDRFDYAFRTYIERWAYKHPQPWDFFNTMSNASGEDLGWFFKSWFMENWSNDIAVEDVEYTSGDYTKGAKIFLANKGEMPMPVDILVTFDDKTTQRTQLPVEIWMTGENYTYHLNSDKKILSVEIDPDKLVPDANPNNNIFKKLREAPAGVTANSVVENYLQSVGGKSSLDKINDYTFTMSASIQGAPMTVKDKVKKSGKYRRTLEIFGQEIADILVNGNQVSLVVQGREQELDTETAEQLQVLTETIFLEANAQSPGYKSELKGMDLVNGEDVYVVEITTPGGQTLKNYYEVESGLKVKEITDDGSTTSYADYKEVNGVKIAHKVTEAILGQDIEMEMMNVEFNTGLKDQDFE